MQNIEYYTENDDVNVKSRSSSKNFNETKNNINVYKDKRSSSQSKNKKTYNDFFDLGRSHDILGSRTDLKIPSSNYAGKNMWLVKATNLNRGRGIKICNNIRQIIKCVTKFSEGICLNFKESEMFDTDIYTADNSLRKSSNKLSKYKSSTVIIQKYLEEPFLYEGRKFDIRIWVLLTHKMEVYFFR